MTARTRASIRATIVAALGAALASTTVFATATLQVVRGRGDFQSLQTSITVTKQEPLIMQWKTDQAGATGGTWKVTNVTAGNTVVASGEAPATTAGNIIRFTIPANAFLQLPSPAMPVIFHITIVPHNAANVPLGSASNAVVVSQVAQLPPQPPVNFGESAVFPSVEIVSYQEKIGIVPLTQLHFAGADVTLRVRNKGTARTDQMLLGIDDATLLMRQSTKRVTIPRLDKGDSLVPVLHLSAILPPPTSQLPEEQQHRQWNQQHRDRCGVKLRVVMDWIGPAANTPMNPHFETALVQEGGGDYVKTPRGTPICDGAQCVTTCEIAENIRQELDGHTVGYSFFVGPHAKFGSHGQARTLADGPPRPFTPSTKVPVASVSKMVTAIAAVRILDKSGGVGIDSTIESRLPSIWSASDYAKKLKFSQLLSHSSGIKDYGNVQQDYISIKNFFSQPVSAGATTPCHGVANDTKQIFTDPINPNDLKWCYSNYNFSIFRILLPRVAGFPEDPNLVTQPKTLANQYVKLVQQNVFDLVGQKDVDCKPPSQGPAASSYAFAYRFPGTQPGQDWGDWSLQCGAAGWYLSVQDIAKVLASINAKDGKILAETGGKQQFDLMRTRQLGWDIDAADPEKELEKNGGFVADCDKDGEHCKTISTSIAIFGPVKGPRVTAALFMNSDISGGPSAGKGAAEVLKKAYDKALLPKP